MKRWICLVLIALLASTMATSCAEEDIVEIEFWHKYSGDEYATHMTAMIEKFMEENPDIKVIELGLPFGDYNQKITPALVGGTGPDLLIGDLDNTPRARARTGQIKSIQQYVDESGFDMDVFFPATVDMCTYEGELYALPFITDTRVLYWNKDHFVEAGLDPEKPPRTWEEVMSYNEKLTIIDENGSIERLGFSTRLDSFGEWTLGWTFGAELWNDDGTPNINSPEMLEALNTAIAIENQVDSDAFNAFYSTTYACGYSPFAEETVSMSISWNGLYNDIKMYNPDMNYGVTFLPTKDGVTNRASWGSGFSLEIVDKGDEARAEAAFRLAAFLCRTDNATSFILNCSDFVCNAAAYEDSRVQEDPVWAFFAESGQYTRFHHFVPEYPTWHYGSLTPEWDAALIGTKEPEQALADAEAWIEQEIENYRMMNPN